MMTADDGEIIGGSTYRQNWYCLKPEQLSLYRRKVLPQLHAASLGYYCVKK
jgi:hypothetical protein